MGSLIHEDEKEGESDNENEKEEEEEDEDDDDDEDLPKLVDYTLTKKGSSLESIHPIHL